MAGVNVQGYLDSIHAPWGQIFYKLAWHNIRCKGKKILDFGSGFGITASHLAAENDVVAIEPNEEMLAHRVKENPYEQKTGSIERLKELPGQCFDIVVCHNVLEYVADREAVLSELCRVLKPDGFMSVIKHNKAGKIMQKAVFEYKIDEALRLLDDEHVESANFGTINEYEDSELENYAGGKLYIEKVYGLRMFYALQRNELKSGEEWLDTMFRLECRAQEVAKFRDIAFFHHVILRSCAAMHNSCT